jgi:hypothetical protein
LDLLSPTDFADREYRNKTWQKLCSKPLLKDISDSEFRAKGFWKPLGYQLIGLNAPVRDGVRDNPSRAFIVLRFFPQDTLTLASSFVR